MLSDVPPIFRKRRGRTRPRLPSAPPTPPGTVTVVSVVAQTTAFVAWTFSAPASTDGSGIPQLLVEMNTGIKPPAESWQGASPSEIICNYDDGAVVPGGAWQVNGQPVGIVFGGGGTLVVPENGAVA